MDIESATEREEKRTVELRKRGKEVLIEMLVETEEKLRYYEEKLEITPEQVVCEPKYFQQLQTMADEHPKLVKEINKLRVIAIEAQKLNSDTARYFLRVETKKLDNNNPS